MYDVYYNKMSLFNASCNWLLKNNLTVNSWVAHPDCLATELEHTVGPCLTDQTRKVTFLWRLPPLCNGHSLPDPVYVSCDYVRSDSAYGSASTAFASIGIIISSVTALWIVRHRNRPGMKRVQPPFCVIFCLGMCTTAFLSEGNESYVM